MLTAMWHCTSMIPIARTNHVAAPTPPAREHRQSDRAAVDFGGAVTHRDLVEAKLRVDPAALADRKRRPQPLRRPEAPPHAPLRDANHEQRVDISV